MKGTKRSFAAVAQELYRTLEDVRKFCSDLERDFEEMIQTHDMIYWASLAVIAQLWFQRLDWSGMRVSCIDLRSRHEVPSRTTSCYDAEERLKEIARAVGWFFPVPHDGFRNISDTDTLDAMDAVDVVRKAIPSILELLSSRWDH